MMQFIHALVVNSRNKLQIRLASNTFFPISIWESYQQDSKGNALEVMNKGLTADPNSKPKDHPH